MVYDFGMLKMQCKSLREAAKPSCKMDYTCAGLVERLPPQLVRDPKNGFIDWYKNQIYWRSFQGNQTVKSATLRAVSELRTKDDCCRHY